MPRAKDEPVRLTRIYTRAGDGGETSLGDGSRVPKTDPRIEAYGTVDELNSLVGLALAGDLPDEFRPFLERVQNDLFDLGADLSVPLEDDRRERLRVVAVHGDDGGRVPERLQRVLHRQRVRQPERLRREVETRRVGPRVRELFRLVRIDPRPGDRFGRRRLRGRQPQAHRDRHAAAFGVGGVVLDASYIGVSTQYLIETGDGHKITVYAQNLETSGAGEAHPDGQRVRLTWQPQHTFVVAKEGS